MDPFVLHVSDVPTLTGRAAVGAVAGLLAAVVMNIPMQRLPEGTAPPFVAAGALTGEGLAEVDPKLASGVHYAAGVLAGVVFTLVAVGLERVLPPRAALAGVGLRIAPHALAALVTFAFLVVFFAYLVLPVFGGEARERAGQVRRDWVVSASVYTVALVAFVVLLVAAL
ncbi:hypothetical protein [Halorarius halobius]|uniref:hypothetical protein n=1 Tax=Halorarius halobius TaxID=2962671 RepID=UPI0020CE8FE3|nr:hypothetical protein [Halorarius halobius]